MLLLEQYRSLARYNQLMNRKLYGHAQKLDDAEQKRDRGAFFGSLYATLNHLLLADRIWLVRFTGDASHGSRDASGAPIRVTGLTQVLYEDFDVMRVERERTDAALVAFVDLLDEAKLLAPFAYESLAGAPQSHVLWWALGHLFNHQTHHRGQATTLLMQAGIDPGVTDLIAMLRDETRFATA